MSDSPKDHLKNNPNNEEIVEELTKELEDSNIKDTDVLEDPTAILDNDSDLEDKETDSEGKNLFNDFIDEAELKTIEEALSEEDKVNRKEESDTLKQKGNEEFKNGKYLESIDIYTQALRLCPLAYSNERSVLYANRAASKIKLNNRESALDDCTKAIELNPNYVKALYRRAKLYEEMDKLDESLEDYKKLQTLDESNNEIKHTIFVLSQKIEKRNEEMKTEMLGKLKDLGNLILKPFGLSTENFQLNQDPNSGGYSVNFQQKK